jgi:DNA-binding MarR family transcriptional regulator
VHKRSVRPGGTVISGRAILDLERHVPYFFTYISNRLSRGASETYREFFGIGITEWRVMGVLASVPDTTANQITNEIGLDKAAVSRALSELERQGLAVTQPDPSDNRSRSVRLTKEGDALHDRIIVAALAREERLLSTLSSRELETLIICLRKLRTNVSYTNAYEPSERYPKRRRRP